MGFQGFCDLTSLSKTEPKTKMKATNRKEVCLSPVRMFLADRSTNRRIIATAAHKTPKNQAALLSELSLCQTVFDSVPTLPSLPPVWLFHTI